MFASRTHILRLGSPFRLAVALLIAFASVSLAPPPVSAVPVTGVTATVVNTGGLNLRSLPNWSAPVVKYLPNGTALTVKSTSGEWFKVTALGRTGWVNSWYTRLNGTPSVVITRGNTSRKMVALTFDAGSDLGYTERIIETLEREGIPATFGLTGTWINAYPAYAEWIVANGFQVINHTLKHYSYTGYSAGTAISPASRLAQLIANEEKIRAAGGWSKPYWRPPYGDYDSGVLRDVGAAGYAYTVMWTVDSLGWDGLSTGDITWRVVNRACNGAIILMHVGSDSADALALPEVIRQLRAKGYAFGTVEDVIA